jgi:hypothetical protein
VQSGGGSRKCGHTILWRIFLWAGLSCDHAGMYLRKTQRRNKDGSVVRYVQLANNRRVDGQTQAEVLVNLAREDRLDLEALRRLVASINRYLGEEDDVTAPLGAEAGPLQVESSRPIGTIWLLDHLWKLLGIDTALARHLDGRRFRGSSKLSGAEVSAGSAGGDAA